MTPTTVELKKDFDRNLNCYSRSTSKYSREDIIAVIDYMLSLKAEVNPSENYRRDIRKCLTKFCMHHRGVNLKQLDRKDVGISG